MEELDNSFSQDTPVWAIFGDLMAGLVGVFVLFLVWTLGLQVELSQSLQQETQMRQSEQARRIVLEEALAGPLAAGRITLLDGRIGISGSVLFASNSVALQSEGRKLLRSLVGPLQVYLDQRDEMLMVSGFTDDLQIQPGNIQFEDNWQLSAERALTVTRTLIEEGMPTSLIFAAAFGQEQPVAPNADDLSRAKNRRVEIAPVPKSKGGRTEEIPMLVVPNGGAAIQAEGAIEPSTQASMQSSSEQLLEDAKH